MPEASQTTSARGLHPRRAPPLHEGRCPVVGTLVEPWRQRRFQPSCTWAGDGSAVRCQCVGNQQRTATQHKPSHDVQYSRRQHQDGATNKVHGQRVAAEHHSNDVHNGIAGSHTPEERELEGGSGQRTTRTAGLHRRGRTKF